METKVRFMKKSLHKTDPDFYPALGTIGVLVEGDIGDRTCLVRWPEGSVDNNPNGEPMWYCDVGDIELVEDKPTLMPYDEIWEMLKPKMMKAVGYDWWNKTVYDIRDAQKCVAIAYKMGYERAMKGRPFKYGEKKAKVKGHWEKVDPENLPKDGTKVKYAREDGRTHYNRPSIGDEGIVEWHGGCGIGFRKNDGTWICVMKAPSCLDYWVEGSDAD